MMLQSYLYTMSTCLAIPTEYVSVAFINNNDVKIVVPKE